MSGIGMLGPALVSGAMGIGSQGRDRRHQEGMADYHAGISKDLANYNQKLKLQYWKDTNFKAQMEQMRMAGLNVGLMYGQGGQGGQTSQPSGQATPGSNPNQPHMMGIGAQLAQQALLMKAQKDNIQADTEKKKVEADKMAGVDTKVGEAQIANLSAGTEQILTETKTEIERLEQERNNTEVSNETIDARIKYAKEEAVGKAIENELNNAKIDLTERQKWQIGQIVSQQWSQIDINKKQLNVNVENAITNKHNAETNRENAISNRQSSEANQQNALTNKQRIIIEEKLKRLGLNLEKQKMIMQTITSLWGSVSPGGRIWN